MNPKLLPLIATLATVIAALVLCNIFGLMGLVLVPLFFAAAMLVSQPKKVLLLFWIMTLITPTADRLLPEFFVKVVEQMFGLYLLAIIVFASIITRQPIPGTKVVNRILVGLLTLMAISAVANKVPPSSVLFYMLTYMKHFWIFYYTLRFVEDKDSRKMFWAIIVTFGIQVLFNVASYLGLNPIPYVFRRGFADASLGTLGGSHYVGYYMIACMFLLIACFKQFPSIRHQLMSLLGTCVALVQFVLTFTLHAYPFLVGGLAFQHVLFSRRSLGALLKTLPVLSLLAVLGILFFAAGPWAYDMDQYLSLDPWIRQLDVVRRGYKGQAYKEIFLRASDHLPYPFLGGGPGNYSSSIAGFLGRPLSRLPHLAYLWFATDPSARLQLESGSIMYGTGSGMIALWGELGPLGLLLYWGFYVYAGGRVWRQTRAGLYTNMYKRVMAEAFVCIVPMMLGINILIDAIALLPLTLGFWIWAACVWNPSENETATERPAQS